MKKLYLLIIALVAAVSANATDLYVVGTVNGWALADANYKMTANTTETMYTYDFGTADLQGQNFKITDAIKSWSDATVNLGSSDKLDNNSTIDLISGGNNIEFASGYKSITNVKITLKKSGDSYTLSVTGTFTKGEAAIPTLYLRGDFSGSTWPALEENAFTRDGNNYTWTLTKTIADPDNFGKFKIADENWGSYNIGGNGSTGVTVGTPYTLVKSTNPSNLWFVSGAAAGTYTFTMTKDGDVWTLTVNKSETAIQSINANAATGRNGKFIKNGRMVVVKNGKTYNMAGQIVK